MPDATQLWLDVRWTVPQTHEPESTAGERLLLETPDGAWGRDAGGPRGVVKIISRALN